VFDIPLDTLRVISDTIFPANLLTGTKHPVFSTNHLTNILSITTAKTHTKTKQFTQGNYQRIN